MSDTSDSNGHDEHNLSHEIPTSFPSDHRAREMREGRNGWKLIVSVPGRPGYPGAGRPSKATLFRERFEAEWDEWYAAYTNARDSGDAALALQAVEKLADRVYGKAVVPLSIVPLDSELPGDELATE
jgi:hypothetical protein